MAKSYIAAPKLPRELSERYQIITEVMAGTLSVSEAARRLGLSRNRFQSLLHRGLAGLVEGIAVQAAGRPAMPESERQLRDQVERLERDKQQLQQRLETAERILGLASGMLKGRIGRGRRSRDQRSDSEEE